jgi:hypothetical protein
MVPVHPEEILQELFLGPLQTTMKSKPHEPDLGIGFSTHWN